MKKTVILLAAGVAASGAFAAGTLRSGGSFLEGAWRAGDSYITNHSEVAYRPVTLKASPDPGYGVAGWYYRTTFNLSANENLENWTALPDGNATSCTISASAPFTSDTHYIALNLRYVKYSLSLNYNGGGGPSSSMTGLCVTNTVTLPVPDSRDGYDFVNWTGANGSVFPAGEPLEPAVALGIGNVDTNFTLMAQWMPHTMSISYVLDGGDFGIEHPDEATNGVAFKVSAPTRTGYSFQGWLVTGYDQYTAKWGTSTPPSNYFAAGSACPPGGGDVWFLNLTPQQDGVVTLTAKWEAKKYNVTLVVSGANNNPTTSLTATYGQTTPSVTTTPRYDNADFMGFYTQPNGQGEKYWNSDGTPYVATWTNDVDMTFYEYKGNIRRLLTFHGNGGVPSQTVTNAVVGATYGSVMPIVSWSGGRYVFAGWFTAAAGGDEVSAEALVAEGSGDIDLYAHWEVAKYCVRFDGNGATNETAMAVQEIPFDAATPLIANEYGKPGYGFVGWTTNGTVATSVDFADCAAVSNLADTAGTTTAVYAVWSPNTYYVSFNPNGGKGSMPVMTNLYGEASVFPENAFTRSGFWSFSCWSNTLSGAMSLPGATFSNLTTEAGTTPGSG